MKFDIWFTEVLVALDQLFHVVFSGPYYLLFGGECPAANETISSRVGRSAVNGEKWALVVERIINAIFSYFGDHDHCRKHIKQCKCKKSCNN